MKEARFGDLQIVTINGRDALTWRPFYADKGDFHRGHHHTIDHVTQLTEGEVEVRYSDGRPTDNVVAPASIQIDADVEHELIALLDRTRWSCTFVIPEGGDARTLSMEL